MGLSTKTLLIFLSGTEEIDRGAKQNHYGKYIFNGYNLHLWNCISSVVENQNKDCSEIVAIGNSNTGFVHTEKPCDYKIYNIVKHIKQSARYASILMKYKNKIKASKAVVTNIVLKEAKCSFGQFII